MQYPRSNSKKSSFTSLFQFFLLPLLTIFFVTTTTTVEASTWVINVGDGGLKFNPDTVTVAPKDTVMFSFLNGPHGVTQSTGPKSCSPLNGGFKSDVLYVNGMFSLKVGSGLGKMYYYCQVGQHCAQGMTGTINVVAAANSSFNTSSGQVNSTASSVVLGSNNDASHGKGSTSVLTVTIGVLASSFFMAIMLL
ncbi:8510_t:CDS:2 [Ambispora leptoticha]|uniref:8510_t:CDS:1 n=1 Tax=Ambispora leptoticha TaxID=144679 RepID=A0A9N8VB48_9GLOM|nr:8510_t:CDS:2 [Ambispora leptoticha]